MQEAYTDNLAHYPGLGFQAFGDAQDLLPYSHESLHLVRIPFINSQHDGVEVIVQWEGIYFEHNPGLIPCTPTESPKAAKSYS